MKKVSVAIIGSGNIGSDLLTKVIKSPVLDCSLFVGRDEQSVGINRAKKMGIRTSTESIDGIIKHADDYQIVFDATNAASHLTNAPILKKLGKFTIDLTPSKYGQMCVPILNLKTCLQADNVNMVSCGGQSVGPIAAAIMAVHPDTAYMELVSSISSYSAGLATRINIDEYVATTSSALKCFSGVPNSKSILILNPAKPPIMMHNTLFARIDRPNLSLLSRKIKAVIAKIQAYVPGYRLILGPILENNRVTIMTRVVGLGDFLPEYAGNLDIINCAAIAVAEAYAKNNNH